MPDLQRNTVQCSSSISALCLIIFKSTRLPLNSASGVRCEQFEPNTADALPNNILRTVSKIMKENNYFIETEN